MVRIPGYKLLERIGSGSAGTVWLAEHEGLARTVAVKVLAPGLFKESEMQARFLREAKVQAKLTHANLVELFDAGVAEGSPYIVTEYVEGGTLRGLVDKGPLPLEDALRLAAGIAAGLSCAHQAGVVHRDLKPENILLTAAVEPKIADFGLAKPLSGDKDLRTAAGTILGTPGYLAPEAIGARSAGTAADVYALGILIAELVTGVRPFQSRDVGSMLKAQLEADGFSALADVPPMPEPVEALAAACLARDPRARPSAEEAETKLRALAAGGIARQRRRIDRTNLAVVRPVKKGPDKRTVVARTEVPRVSLVKPALAVGFLLAVGLGVSRLAWHHDSKAPVTPSAPFVWLSGGRTTVRAQLGSPSRVPVRVELMDIGSGRKASLEIPAGKLWGVCEGLSPRSTWRAEVESAGQTQVLTVSTLRSILKGEALELRGVEDIGVELGVAVQGEALLLAWTVTGKKDRTSYIQTIESPDGGVTWGAIENVGEPVPKIDNLCAAGSPAGWAMAWLETRNGKSRGMMRVKKPGTPWLPPADFECVDPGPAMQISPDGKVDVALVRTGEGGPEIRWKTLELGEKSKAMPGPDLTGTRLTWLTCARSRGRACLLALDEPLHKPRRFVVASSADPSAGGWTAWKQVGDLPEASPFQNSFATPEKVLLATADSLRAAVHVSEDGGLTFTSHPMATEGGMMVSFPAAAAMAGKIAGTCIQFSPGYGQAEASIWLCADGKTWTHPPGFVISGTAIHRGVRLVPLGDRLGYVQLTLSEGVLFSAKKY